MIAPYVLGALTPAMLVVLVVFARATVHLWRAVRRHGGEDERVLTRGGRIVQRLLQALARALGLRPARSAA